MNESKSGSISWSVNYCLSELYQKLERTLKKQKNRDSTVVGYFHRHGWGSVGLKNEGLQKNTYQNNGNWLPRVFIAKSWREKIIKNFRPIFAEGLQPLSYHHKFLQAKLRLKLIILFIPVYRSFKLKNHIRVNLFPQPYILTCVKRIDFHFK